MGKKARNYKYNRRIRRLCYRVLKGDAEAELLLKAELDNPLAQKVVRRVIASAKKNKQKRMESMKRFGIPAARVRGSLSETNSKSNYPCQGGSPGLGKRA